MRTGRGVASDDVRARRHPEEADEADLRLCRPIGEGGGNRTWLISRADRES